MATHLNLHNAIGILLILSIILLLASCNADPKSFSGTLHIEQSESPSVVPRAEVTTKTYIYGNGQLVAIVTKKGTETSTAYILS
jgi:starvation-inducible outer membrane lipoprotein